MTPPRGTLAPIIEVLESVVHELNIVAGIALLAFVLAAIALIVALRRPGL